ncbi:protein TUNICAMYCIN INDUCED 1-like [Musa acuminata AAA Group]|uniref:protein TUNICAMYCIN INDUCED 1-like n=1 Tax=Musa acuminata AAA Group TaxID=214697 RepID=UPI0031E17360
MAMPSTVLVAVFLLFLAAGSFDSSTASLPFNSSFTLLPPPPPDSPLPRPLLREVVRALAAKEGWDPAAEVRIADLDGKTARVGVSQRYEFHVRVGRRAMILRFYDEAVSWRRADGAVVESGSDLVAGDGVAGLTPAVRALELVGPLDLRVDGGGGDADLISLHLPTSNITYSGLRKIFVGIGIRIKIEGAQGVSLSHPYDIGLSLNGSLAAHVEHHNKFWHLGYSSCVPHLSVHVMGSVSVSAHGYDNTVGDIEAAFKTDDTVELLPAKCYSNGRVKQISSCSFCFVSSRLSMLDKLVGGLLGNNVSPDTSVRFTKAKITSATEIKFRLQLERDITENNNRSLEKVPEWKQKPKAAQIWLEIMARVEGEGRLKPVLVKKLKRPYTIADSISFSSLMSNISFTKFPSFVVPPEALTLDVKW